MTGKALGSALLVLQVLKKIDAFQMWIRFQILESIDGRCGNFILVAKGKPESGIFVGHDTTGCFIESSDMLSAHSHRLESVISSQLQIVCAGKKISPVFVCIRHHADIAIAGLVGFSPGGQGPGVADLVG